MIVTTGLVLDYSRSSSISGMEGNQEMHHSKSGQMKAYLSARPHGTRSSGHDLLLFNLGEPTVFRLDIQVCVPTDGMTAVFS